MAKNTDREVIVLLKLRVSDHQKVTPFSLLKLLRAGRRYLIEMRNCQDCVSVTLKKCDDRTKSVSEERYEKTGDTWAKHGSPRGYFEEVGK